MNTIDTYAQRLHEMVGDAPPASEKRSTLADPDSWLQSWFSGGGQSVAGVMVNEHTALNIAAVFQAVRVLSDAVASLPFRVYRHENGGPKEMVRAHPCAKLMEKQPNPEMTPFIFRQTLMAHALLWGNGYAEIERTKGGVPLRLWPLRPDRVIPERDPANRSLVYRVYQPGRSTVTLQPQDVYHLRGLGFDGLVGYPVIRLARQSLGLAVAAETFGASFFGNGTKTGGVLTYPGTLSEVAKKNLRDSMQAEHGGPYNANKFLILEDGMTWTANAIPPNDAQFLDTREFTIDEIARWFNIPPHKLNDLRRATNNNVEQQSIDFVQHSLRPWLINGEEEAEAKLIAEEDQDTLYAEHRIEGMLRADQNTRYTAHSKAIQFGFKCVDEVRAEENLNPLPDGAGQLYLVPVNMQPAEVVEAQAKAAQAGMLNSAPWKPGDPLPAKPAPGAPPPPALPSDPDVVDEEDESDTARASAVVGAHRGVLVEAFSRVVRREVEVLRRAAKKPETFEAYLGRFSGEHGSYVLSTTSAATAAISASLRAVGLDGQAAAADAVAKKLPAVYTADMSDELRGMTATTIEPTLARWEQEKAGAAADAVLESLRTSP